MATNEQLIHDVTCVFDDGKFILGDLPEPMPEVFTVRFTTPEVFTQGNTIVVNGRTMNLRTPGGINASSAFFRAGTVFHCDVDFGKGYVYAWYNTATTNHSILINRDVAGSHPSSAISHGGQTVEAVLDELERKTETVVAEAYFQGDCSYNSGVFEVSVPSMPSTPPNFFTVRFRAPASFTAGEVFQVKGMDYVLRAYDMATAKSNVFATDAVVLCNFDAEKGNCFINASITGGGGEWPGPGPEPGDGKVILIFDSALGDTLTIHNLHGLSSNFVIDYGDGTILSYPNIPEGDLFHRFANTGIYHVTISGSRAGFILRDNEGIVKVYGQFPKGVIPGTLFQNCVNLESISDNIFANIEDQHDFQFTFDGCHKLEQIPGGLFKAVPGVVNMTGIFRFCTSLRFIPEDLFKYNSELRSINSMFRGSGLEYIPEKLFSYNHSLEDFHSAFTGCTSLKSIPSELFKYQYQAQHFTLTFSECGSLEYVPYGLFDYCDIASEFSSCFYECKSIISKVPALWLKQTAGGSRCYHGCVMAENYLEIPENWK